MILLLTLLPALLLAQTPSSVSTDSLIAELGSANYADREKATKALMQRPDAVAAVGLATRSSNTEVSRRATVILEALVMSDLKISAKQGKLQRVIDLVAGWPAGKYEQESRDVVRDLAKNLTSLDKQNGGKNGFKNTPFVEEWWNKPQKIISADRFTEELIIERSIPPRPSFFLLRAREVDLKYSRLPNQMRHDTFWPDDELVVISSGSVQLRHIFSSVVIFAGGDVKLFGELGCSIIVSGGDVSCGDATWGTRMATTLIVARGKVTCSDRVKNCHIISGKSVVCNQKFVLNSIITENEPNPLGFVHWSDPPKQKAEAKQP